jgi:PAS domain S-box-containing protein
MVDGIKNAEQARQRLYNIVRKDVPFNAKACEILSLGKQFLDVDNAYLTQIDQETDHWEIVITADMEDGPPPSLDLGPQETYCGKAIEASSAFALHDTSEQGWDDDPALEISGQHAYLSIPLITEKEPYGTVCFTTRDPPPEPFSEAERQFAEHLTRLLEREVEKDLIDGELTNQTNLTAVLHRVLRHNLRNDISIIRGYTELMAEQLDNDSVGQTALSHIDDLIYLSQKARELEEIITTSPKRQVTQIGALVDEVSEELTQEYPEASITVEYENEIQARVLQNFDRAIEELIENAVKHSGDAPRVTVAVGAVPNGIEIQIEDNGPGLPDHEAEVLTSGEETPLSHGSGLGLWLAYWIVSSHDGSIHPEVTEHGTIMKVTIPRKPTINAKQLTKLTRSRDKYKASFEKASDTITIINDDGRIIDANEAASTIFGVEADELLGRSLTEFFPNELEFNAEWHDFLETTETGDTMTVTGADGVERTIEYTGTSNIITGQHLFICRDITERKEREEELQLAETVFQTTQDALFLADVVDEQEYRLNRVNKSFEDITQRSNVNIVGMGPRELLGQEVGGDVQTRFDECVASQAPVEFEQIVPVNNEERILNVRVSPVIQDGEVTQLVGAIRHITEQKEREQELTALKQRYQSLLEAAPDPLFVADPETGEIIEVNEAAETLLDMPSEEILGMHQSEIHPAEQADLYQQTFKRQVESDGLKRQLPDGSQLTVVTAQGDRVPVEISATTVSLPNGPVTFATFRDVSEQVKREQELEATTQRLQLALEGTDTGVWEWHIGMDEVRWSESLERLVGIEPGTFEGTFDAFEEYIHPDDRQNVTAAIERAAMSECRFQTEYRLQCEDGAQIWVESRGEVYSGDNKTKRMVGIATDITKRKEHEAELTRKAEAMEKAPVGIVLTDPDQSDNPMVYANERFCELTGYTESDVFGRNCRFMQGPETDPESVAEIRDAIDNEESVSTVLRNYRKDGTIFWNHVRITPIRDENGEVSNWVGFQEDVTECIEREQKTEELEQLATKFETQYRTLFEEAPVMTVLTRTEDGEPVIEDCNSQFAETLGYDEDAMIGSELADFYTPESVNLLLGGGYRRSLNGEFTTEKRELVTAQGEIVETLLRAVPRRTVDEDIIGTMAMYIDISEREVVKRENERLEEFTSVVSHDLRSPLDVATLRVQLAAEECDSEHLGHAEQALDRMKALIDDLLTLAQEGGEVTDSQPVDLAEMINSSWKTVETKDASLITDIAREVWADRSRLKQVFENLFRNAIEHGGADVTVTIGELDGGFYIEDNGPGIPSSECDDVFETGYSRSTGGTGFGLSIVKQIVTAHGWTIRVTDGPDGGARFEITNVDFVD